MGAEVLMMEYSDVTVDPRLYQLVPELELL
jgi:hypothetical protein